MYENKLNFNFYINQYILQKISLIDSFKGKWEFIENKKNLFLKELKKITIIESIGSSTRIDGADLANDKIKKLLRNIKNAKFNTKDQQEAIGYYDALINILNNFKKINITENYIKYLHKLLFGKSEKDKKHRGDYKAFSNTDIIKYLDDTEKITFKTSEPFLVKREMSDLVSSLNKNIKKNKIHPLIITALFIYEFLSIHPFQKGNFMLSRLLTTLLLMKSNYHFIQYVSFEQIIEKRKKEYYQALIEGQKNRNKKNEKIDLWILFFLDSLEMLIEKLNIKYKVYTSKGGYLNNRQKTLLVFIRKNNPVKIHEIDKQFLAISRNTIKKDLQYLKHQNYIEQMGKNKSAVYLIRDKI